MTHPAIRSITALGKACASLVDDWVLAHPRAPRIRTIRMKITEAGAVVSMPGIQADLEKQVLEECSKSAGAIDLKVQDLRQVFPAVGLPLDIDFEIEGYFASDRLRHEVDDVKIIAAGIGMGERAFWPVSAPHLITKLEILETCHRSGESLIYDVFEDETTKYNDPVLGGPEHRWLHCVHASDELGAYLKAAACVLSLASLRDLVENRPVKDYTAQCISRLRVARRPVSIFEALDLRIEERQHDVSTS